MVFFDITSAHGRDTMRCDGAGGSRFYALDGWRGIRAVDDMGTAQGADKIANSAAIARRS